MAQILAHLAHLSAQLPEQTNRLREKLRDWQRGVNAQMALTNPNYVPDKRLIGKQSSFELQKTNQ